MTSASEFALQVRDASDAFAENGAIGAKVLGALLHINLRLMITYVLKVSQTRGNKT